MSIPVSTTRTLCSMQTADLPHHLSPPRSPLVTHGDPARPTFWSPLAEPFLAEWRRLDRRPTIHRRVAEWPIDGYAHGPDARLDDLLHVLGLFGNPTDDDADARLATVVGLAAHDELAARVVFHRVLPALVAVATRRARRYSTSRRVAFADLVSHAWIVVRTYPIDRRPRHVAAGIVRDVEYHAFVRDHRLRSADEIPMSDGPISAEPARIEEAEPLTVVIELLRDAKAAGMDADDLRFAAEWVSGSSTLDLARSFAMCERSVRNRRRRVVAGLRSVAGDHFDGSTTPAAA